MTGQFAWLSPRQGDLDVVNACRASRGLGPASLIWTCQHSCPPERIEACDDPQCDASPVIDLLDVARVRECLQLRDIASLSRVVASLAFAGDAETLALLCAELASWGDGLCGSAEGDRLTLSGSLLAFACLCACQGEPNLSGTFRELLADMETAILQEFSRCGPVLLRQRYVDIRSDREARGEWVTILARASWPAFALVAWEAGGAEEATAPVLHQAFGLRPGQRMRRGLTRFALDVMPGDLYGPTARIDIRLDGSAAASLRARCLARADTLSQGAGGQAVLEALQDVAANVGLSALLPGSMQVASEEEACAQLTAAVRRLLWALPLA